MQKALPPDGFDPAPLDRLIDLVGPAQAGAFLAQLTLDIRSCDRRIAAGLAARDWPTLRDASHDLISLAGSAGATGLHGLAKALNSTAHAQDADTLAALVPRIRSGTAGLLAHLGQRSKGAAAE
jgi:HPt (histidine-containing phosphotransfer) domain-containing protein